MAFTSPGASVRYTLDGSTPSATVGTEYTSPFSVSTTTTVRAVAYTSSNSVSPVATNTYIFLNDVRAQSDTPLPGWPTTFAASDVINNGVNNYPADYEMDPQVLDHPNNSATGKFETVMKSLPTLSIVTDLPNLWNPVSGIYFRPNAKNNSPVDPAGNLWERASSVEWINPDGTSGFSQLAGLSIDGETSRRPFRQPKKDFRLSFNSKYGTAGLNFELFNTSDPTGSFDQLLLRNGGSRNWSYFDSSQRREADYVNDEWARRAWGQMGNLETHGTYVHLYLNGLYWGLYNVTERLDTKFLQSYLGSNLGFDIVQASDDLGNNPIATAGTVAAWNDVLALVGGTNPIDNTTYVSITNKVDVANLADYFVHAQYIGKTDWPVQNWNAYRATSGTDTRFKFTPLNNDTGLNKLAENTTTITYTNGAPYAPSQVFSRLLTNSEFVQVLSDRFYKHVVSSNGALTSASCVALYTDLTNTIDQAVIAESARWGDYWRDKSETSTQAAPKGRPAYLHSRDLPNAYTDPTSPTSPSGAVSEDDQKTWVQVVNAKKTAYCPGRSNTLVTQYTANGWYKTAVKAPTFSKQGGSVQLNSTVTLNNPNTNAAGDIYYTTDGTDPRSQFGAVAAGVVARGDSTTVAIGGVTTVKARVFDGSAWSPLVEYKFYVNQTLGNLVINELHYNPLAAAGQSADSLEFIELYNKGNSTLALEDVTFKSGVLYRFPAGATLEAGKYLVLASNATSFQARYGFAPFGAYSGLLSDMGEKVELVDALGATVADTVTYQNTTPWPFGANGGGGSLSLKTTTADNAQPANWFASVINGGTPGIANNATPANTNMPTITWNNPAAIAYGAALSETQLNATVTYNGQPVEGVYTYTPAAGTLLNAGVGQILRVIFEPNDATYASVNAAVQIDVTKAPLTIKAEDKIKTVGLANPPFTAVYTGFLNGDTVASLDASAVITTTATEASPIGTYPIVVSGAADANYQITFGEGVLTVTNKVVPTITWAEPAAITYGTALSQAQLNATATSNGQSVAGTFSYSSSIGTVLEAGNDQTISLVFTPNDTNAYAPVSTSVKIDVNKAPLSIRADNKARQVGKANPALTATYTGFVNGDTVASLDTPVTISTTATESSPAGNYLIIVGGAADKNYAISFFNGSLTVSNEPVVEPPVEVPTQFRVLIPLAQR